VFGLCAAARVELTNDQLQRYVIAFLPLGATVPAKAEYKAVTGGFFISSTHAIVAKHHFSEDELADGVINEVVLGATVARSKLSYLEFKVVFTHASRDFAVLALQMSPHSWAPFSLPIKRGDVLKKQALNVVSLRILAKLEGECEDFTTVGEENGKVFDVPDREDYFEYAGVVRNCGDSGLPLLLDSNNVVVGLHSEQQRAGGEFSEASDVETTRRNVKRMRTAINSPARYPRALKSSTFAAACKRYGAVIVP